MVVEHDLDEIAEEFRWWGASRSLISVWRTTDGRLEPRLPVGRSGRVALRSRVLPTYESTHVAFSSIRSGL